MEEKFYYTKKFLKSDVISGVLFIALVSFSCLLKVVKKEISIWWIVFVVYGCIAALHSLIRILILRKRPMIVVTDSTITYVPPNSYTFRKRVLHFDQIISASVIDAGNAIKITYNKSNNKQGFLTIKHIYLIQDYKKVIEILKQRVKFV